MKRRTPLALALALSLAACGPPPPGVVDKHYRKGRLDGRMVHVLPLRIKKIHGNGDLEKTLPAAPTAQGGTAEVLTRLFNTHLASYSLPARLALDSAWAVEASAIKDTTLYVPGRKLKWPLDFVLVKPETMQEKGFAPDLALMISHVEALRDFNSAGGGYAPAAHPLSDSGEQHVSSGIWLGGGKSFLALTGQYMLWDYLAGRPVCYGRFAVGSAYADSLTAENWDEAMQDVVRLVIDHSPYRGARSAKARRLKPAPAPVYTR